MPTFVSSSCTQIKPLFRLKINSHSQRKPLNSCPFDQFDHTAWFGVGLRPSFPLIALEHGPLFLACYSLIAATRRKRPPSDRRSVIFSPQASSSLAYARVWRMSAIASLPPFLSTRAASRSAFARSPAPCTL